MVFTRNMCIKVLSKYLLLITADGQSRKKQMDKKAVFIPRRFGTLIRKKPV